ncbi:hypothetical protein ADEAN_000670500 [Angomonas deanei]|uniref:Uncharacterized protein n=1 Tax=Angomonas deanei TaxID=59799 RepID=A0A7G2CKV3_9TRYP|nr:hypothetical protein ADEAN_000670500 [Angomonas deanei]
MSQYSLPNDLLPAHFNRQEKESPSVSVPILQEDRTQLLLELESQKDSNDHYRNNNHSNGGVARRRRRGAENSYQDCPTANHGEEDTRRHLRAYRSTYYTNRLSYCYLFIFFLIAVGNLSGLFYYWHYTKGKTDDGFRTNRTDDPDGPPPLAEDIQKRKREEREWLVSALQTTMQAHHSKRRQTDETEDVFSVLSQQETLFHSPHAPPSPSGRYFTKGFYKGLSQPEERKKQQPYWRGYNSSKTTFVTAPTTPTICLTPTSSIKPTISITSQ